MNQTTGGDANKLYQAYNDCKRTATYAHKELERIETRIEELNRCEQWEHAARLETAWKAHATRYATLAKRMTEKRETWLAAQRNQQEGGNA